MSDPRILIDGTPVSATTPMTGIPRVLFEYIKWGYRFGFSNNVAVLPVYVNDSGIFDARVNLPEWMSHAPTGHDEAVPSVRVEGALTKKHKRRAFEVLVNSVGRPLARVVEAPLWRIGLGAALPSLKFAYNRWQRAANERLVSKFGVEIGPGDVLFMPAY
jgi:hypothetical protein